MMANSRGARLFGLVFMNVFFVHVCGDVVELGRTSCHLDLEAKDTGLIKTGSIKSISYNCSCDPNATVTVEVMFVMEHRSVAELISNSSTESLTCGENSYQSSTESSQAVNIKGVFLGRTWINIWYKVESPKLDLALYDQEAFLNKAMTGWNKVEDVITVAVIRRPRIIDKLFIGLIVCVVTCVKFMMGCKIDLNVIREVMRKPFAPAIGLSCQFIVMPLTAFAVVRLFGLSGGVALGFFAAGCSPGGGASNMYSYVLGGDLTLSITMTLISMLASLAMIPLWMFTLGQYILQQQHSTVSIPFLNIIASLAGIFIPLSLGVLLKRFRPNWAKKVERYFKPVVICAIILTFSVGITVNLHIFKMFTPLMILAGAILPYTGFVLGGIVAALLRQPWYRVKTIAIETGIQNIAISLMILKLSLPQPDSDLSLISPVVVATLTPLPLLLAVLVLEVRRRFCNVKAEDNIGATNNTSEDTTNDKNNDIHLKDYTNKDNGCYTMVPQSEAANDTKVPV